QAVQLMTGHGGWPMSVFLTPEAQPFYAGTYFPPDDRHGMPGFRRVLAHVSQAYRTRRQDVDEASKEVTAAIQRGAGSLTRGAGSPTRGAGSLTREQGASGSEDPLHDAASRLAQNYDPVYGGFGGAPKFPPSMTLDFLMQIDAGREIVVNTLTRMERGG